MQAYAIATGALETIVSASKPYAPKVSDTSKLEYIDTTAKQAIANAEKVVGNDTANT
jgi:hypothetical protein